MNKGEFLAEGPAGEMVDLYKKILAGRMDDLEADLAKRLDSNFSDMMELNNDINKTHAKEYHGLMKEKISINPNKTEYGDGRAEIYDLGLLDSKGELTNLLLKGEEFTIREKIRFNANIESPIFTFTIKDKKGTELSGTNTMFEGVPVKPVKPGDEAVVEFKQKMTLQGGEYLLSMSCTGFENGTHVVYHRLYDVTFITVISNKNTVGVYDMESKVNLTQKSN